MTIQSKERELPSLEELLDRRGIHKSTGFDDYQDFIKTQQQAGVAPRLIKFPRIFPQGSMHLALGRISTTKRFWTWRDKE